MIRELTSRFQAVNLDANIAVVVDVISNQSQSAEIYVAEISAESKLIPEQFMQIFDGFGGVYMTKVTWNVARRTWIYEVIIFEK